MFGFTDARLLVESLVLVGTLLGEKHSASCKIQQEAEKNTNQRKYLIARQQAVGIESQLAPGAPPGK